MTVKASVFQLLKELKADVDKYIFEFLPINHEIPEIELLYKMMRDYPSRSGKGLRPGLLMLFNRALGGRDEFSLNSAAALELFQNWIVIHDDIEDFSDLRRGLPALHVKYGVPLALNAGDALAGKMWELVLKNTEIIGIEKGVRVFGEFLYMYDQTTAGQHIELSWVVQNRWNISQEDYFNMCRRKTAWYTCITPCWAGALIAGIDDFYKNEVINFGMDLGIAFQIQDDVLNLVADIGKYGKEIAGDLWEGKRTLVIIDLLGKCTEAERKFVVQALNLPRDKKDDKDIEIVMDLIKKYDSITFAAGISQEHARKARKIFVDSIAPLMNNDYRDIILELIEFIVNREL